MNPPRALSLFSGVGLHDLGLVRAGWEIAAQVEIDPWCRAVLEKHWPGLPRWEDVRNVTAESLRGLGRIDLVTGGFPCPDISTAGRGVGLHRGERSSLWFQMLRIVRLVRPAFVLAENVPALYSRGIDTVLAGLEAAGYAAWPVVVGAWAVGAPHRRDRVWIVGRRVGDTNSEGLEGAGAGPHQGWPGPPRGCRGGLGNSAGDDERGPGAGPRREQEPAGGPSAGVGDSAVLGRGEGAGRTTLAGLEAPRRAVPRGARQGGLADTAGCGCRASERDDDAGKPEAPRRGSGLADPDGPGHPLDPREPGGPRPECPPVVGSGGGGVADAERDALRQLEQREPAGRLPGNLRDGGQAEPGGVRPAGVADSDGERSRETGGLRLQEPEEWPSRRGEARWPAGRYQPQHPWEPPRLVFPDRGGIPEPGVGRSADGSPAGVDGPPGGDRPRALREARFRSWCRKERLKGLGNANPPDVPEIIGRWMLEIDA